MNERVKKAFEECNKFIDEHTSEELIEYEKSLNLDYDFYNQRNFTEEDLKTLLNIFDVISYETWYRCCQLLPGRKFNEKENIAHE